MLPILTILLQYTKVAILFGFLSHQGFLPALLFIVVLTQVESLSVTQQHSCCLAAPFHPLRAGKTESCLHLAFKAGVQQRSGPCCIPLLSYCQARRGASRSPGRACCWLSRSWDQILTANSAAIPCLPAWPLLWVYLEDQGSSSCSWLVP